MNWGDLLGNAASGGLLGLLSSGVSMGLSVWKTREERAAKREERDFQLKQMEVQSQIDIKKAEMGLKVETERQAGESFTESIKADAAAKTETQWVSDMKALMRPIVTILLMTLTGAIYFTSPEEPQLMIAEAIVTATSGAVFWWFGTRATSRFTLKPQS